MEEAKDKTVDLILSYHPPIFSPLKRLTQASWKERLIVECVESRIAVFSPHTSYDAVDGGVNDWLISAFGKILPPAIDQYIWALAVSPRRTGGGSKTKQNEQYGFAWFSSLNV